MIAIVAELKLMEGDAVNSYDEDIEPGWTLR
jgi:hypothetical protein